MAEISNINNVFQICSVLFTLISGYIYIKFTVSNHSKSLEVLDSKMNAAFRKLDNVSDRILTIENNASEFLEKERAYNLYVSNKQLEAAVKLLEEKIKKKVNK